MSGTKLPTQLTQLEYAVRFKGTVRLRIKVQLFTQKCRFSISLVCTYPHADRMLDEVSLSTEHTF